MLERPLTRVLKGNTEYDAMSDASLKQVLMTGYANSRQLALSALARRMHNSTELRESVFTAIESPKNLQDVVMGTFTVSMIGAMAVLENGDETAYKRLKQSLVLMPSIQRKNLFDYLLMATEFDYERSLDLT